MVVERINRVPQIFRIKIDAVIGQIAETGIQHAENVGGFVVDDGFRLLVPKNRNGGTAGIMRIGAGIGFVHISEAVQPVAIRTWIIAEFPTLVGERRLHN
ncbi:hypothetical protein D3C80_1091690 [compost metagenome]